MVRIVDANATDMNAEIATQNTAGLWLSEIKFDNAGNAFLFFASYESGAFGTALQKLTAVDSNQTDIDTDISTQATTGYVPTGIFVLGAQAFIFYSLLNPSGGGGHP